MGENSDRCRRPQEPYLPQYREDLLGNDQHDNLEEVFAHTELPRLNVPQLRGFLSPQGAKEPFLTHTDPRRWGWTLWPLSFHLLDFFLLGFLASESGLPSVHQLASFQLDPPDPGVFPAPSCKGL